MRLIDKNETLVSPEGSSLYGVTAEGAYLKVMYENRMIDYVVYTDIFLNDQGREVIRTQYQHSRQDNSPAPEPVKLGFWARLMRDFKRGE